MVAGGGWYWLEADDGWLEMEMMDGDGADAPALVAGLPWSPTVVWVSPYPDSWTHGRIQGSLCLHSIPIILDDGRRWMAEGDVMRLVCAKRTIGWLDFAVGALEAHI